MEMTSLEKALESQIMSGSGTASKDTVVARSPSVSNTTRASFTWDNDSGAKSCLKRPKDQRGSAIAEVQANQQKQKEQIDKHRPPHYIENVKLTQACYAIIRTKMFKYNFYVLIVLNSIEMGLSMAYNHKDNDDMWRRWDFAFASLWTIETLLLIFALGHRLFTSFWHTLSFLCTVAAISDLVFRSTSLGEDFKLTSQLIRTTRLLMLGKLFDINSQTKIIVTALVRSLGALRGVLVVILVVCYASTLMVYSIVYNKEEEYKAVDFNELNIEFDFDTHFGNMSKTMLTLFSVLIVSEWDSVARATFKVQPGFTIFWVVYTVVLSFGLTNVLVGIIVDTVNILNMEHQTWQAEKGRARLKHAISQISELIFGEDDDVDFDEFIEATSDHNIITDTLSELHVPAGFTFGDLFAVLDDDKDGTIQKTDLADGLFSLVSGNENARFLLQSLHISRCHTDIVECRENLLQGQKSILQAVQGLTMRTAANEGFLPPPPTPPLEPPTVLSHESTLGDGSGTQALNIASPTPVRDRIPREAASHTSSPSPVKPKKMKPNMPADDLWGQCYQTLYDSAVKHCKMELDAAWARLQEVHQTIKSDVSRGGLILCKEEDEIFNQEQLVVRNKLHAAVSSESAGQLRKALDHAIATGIDSSQLNIEFTYNDALKRQEDVRLPVIEVQHAMDKGDWSSALDMVIESALNFGVNKNILSHVLTKVCDSHAHGQVGAGSTSGGPSPPSQEPSVAGRIGNIRTMEIRFKEPQDQSNTFGTKEAQKGVLSLLHSEACKHSREAMDKAWEVLEASGQLQGRSAQCDGQIHHSPLSQPEEAFFIYNQLFCAVQKKSLADLQRAIAQAVVAGMDMRSIDVEVAYRDALARYHKGSSHVIRLAVDAFKRREWYLTVDLLVQVSLARGGDRQSLLRAVTKI